MLLHAGVSAENISRSEAHPWYALKVRTRSEPVATVALRNRGYDAFSRICLMGRNGRLERSWARQRTRVLARRSETPHSE